MAKRGGSEADVPLSRFGVLVAQLESVAASARQQPPDAHLCFDLLSELVSAIEEASKETIIPWQRKCEEALFSLLIKGLLRPVRHLASLAMTRVIEKGDNISVYSRVSSLQGWLAESKRSEPTSCAGAAQCLGELYRVFGRRITSGLAETTSIAAKMMRFHEDFVRQDALLMLQNALDGSGGVGTSVAFSEAFRILTRVAAGDKAYTVRLASAKCLKTFAQIQAPGLGVPDLENAASYCTKALDDPVSFVRHAFAEALGAFLALEMNLEEQMKQNGSSSPPRKLEGGIERHLIAPFMRASGARARDTRIGLTLSWVFFLQTIHLKYHFPDSELQDLGLKALNILKSSSSVKAHALACVLYILRVGIADQMTELTQRSFLVLLCRQLESSDFRPFMGVAVLRMQSYLLTTLGQVPQEFKEILDDTVVAALSHSSIHVRVEASMTLRTVAEVDPTCVGGLISYGVTTLSALRENIFNEKGSYSKFDLDSVHGQASVLAALVSVSPRLRLGYPARLPKSVFEVTKKMLLESSRNPVAAAVEREAGWLLLSSLIASMPKQELEDQIFDILLLWAGPFVTNIEDYLSEHYDFVSETRVLSAALEALSAFIKNFVSPTITTNSSRVALQPVLVYLRGALSYMRSLRARQVQGMKPYVNVFIIKILMAYQSLLDPLVYKDDHPQIIETCTSPFSYPSEYDESSCLRWLLDKRDAFLGPWTPGRDFLEDELRAFEGGEDALLPCLWEDQNSFFPQSENVGKTLVNQMLLCLGSIFACQESAGKLQLLNVIDQSLKSGRKQLWHGANLTNASVVLLVGIKAMLSSRMEVLDNQILTTIQQIFQNILAEGEISAAHRRACAEGLGLLARLGNDSFASRMTRSLISELSTATDADHVGSLALSLGCIHRSAGGIALSSLVPATVSSISSLARIPHFGVQPWSLHSLLLVIEAAGLSYLSQVQATLSLAVDVLLAEENGLVDLRQGIGRLINAIVAVIGPELSPGGTFFSRCRSVVAEIGSGQETSTLLESVRFTQQLVVFAPQAVSVHSHLQTLLPTLSSKQPTLRQLAVSTLRHLIEKDTVSIIEEHIEGHLFRMFDEETDSEIGNLVRATISRLLDKSCPSCPSRWLTICGSMALVTSNGRNDPTEHAKIGSGISNQNANNEKTSGLYFAEDDENMIASKQQAQNITTFSSVYHKNDKHMRYRTRVFAAECLSCIPLAVGADPAHFDLALARRHASTKSNDWLVLHLQELVSLAYQISTCQFESMQPIGVKLLLTIMDKFENIPDPELPGHLLLEQYQVQFVSAIRCAINISSEPSLMDAGLQLAAKILTNSMLGGDPVSLHRMFSLISRSLDDFDDIYYPSFAEWVACEIKIRLLAAHASIKCYVYSLLRERKSIPREYLQLIPLFSDTSSKLGKRWINLLKDYSFLSLGLSSKISHKSFLEGIQSSIVSSKVFKCLEETWPIILQAIALDAVPENPKPDKSSDRFTNGLAHENTLSGHIMVHLELRDFDLLWVLAVLSLFQMQQSLLPPKETVPLARSEKLMEKMSEIAFVALQFLSTEAFFNAEEFIGIQRLKELFQVLLLLDDKSKSCNSASVMLFSKIIKCCPGSFLSEDDFLLLASQLSIQYIVRISSSADVISKDQTILDTALSAAIIAAERLLLETKSLNHLKLKLDFLSTSYECIAGISAEACLSKLLAFMRKIPPLLVKQVEDDAPYDDMYAIISVWISFISSTFRDCIEKLHALDSHTGEQWKNLARKLSFCLEDSIIISKMVYANKLEEGIRETTLVSLCNQCIEFFKIALRENNVKVQAIGLLVLKNAIQKSATKGSSDSDTRDFLLLFAGELFPEIFFLVQKNTSKEAIPVCEEGLRFLFLLYTLAQENERSELLLSILLESIITIFSGFADIHIQETKEIKATAMKLISHLIQSPSAAAHIKDILLSMPPAHRQMLQEIIRSSLSQDESPSLASKPSSQSLSIILPSQPSPIPRQISLPPSQQELPKPETQDDDDDYDDDWDTFQSLPANDGMKDQHHAASDGLTKVSPMADDDDDDDDNWETFQSLTVTDSSSEVTNPVDSTPGLERESLGSTTEKNKDEDHASHVSPMADNDDDDKWETFQSLPVTDSSSEVSASVNSPPGLERESQNSTTEKSDDQEHASHVSPIIDDDNDNGESFQSSPVADGSSEGLNSVNSSPVLERESQKSTTEKSEDPGETSLVSPASPPDLERESTV